MTRGEKAKEYFLQGYNCSQSVAMAFSDLIGMDEAQIARAVCGFGGGIGRMREVCGTISGATFVLSMLYGYSDPKDFANKKSIYCDVQSVANKFKEANGSIICRELLGLDKAAKTPQLPKNELSSITKSARVQIFARTVQDFSRNTSLKSKILLNKHKNRAII